MPRDINYNNMRYVRSMSGRETSATSGAVILSNHIAYQLALSHHTTHVSCETTIVSRSLTRVSAASLFRINSNTVSADGQACGRRPTLG